MGLFPNCLPSICPPLIPCPLSLPQPPHLPPSIPFAVPLLVPGVLSTARGWWWRLRRWPCATCCDTLPAAHTHTVEGAAYGGCDAGCDIGCDIGCGIGSDPCVGAAPLLWEQLQPAYACVCAHKIKNAEGRKRPRVDSGVLPGN